MYRDKKNGLHIWTNYDYVAYLVDKFEDISNIQSNVSKFTSVCSIMF